LPQVPFIGIEAVSIDPARPPGTGEQELLSRWEIRLVISQQQPNPKIFARDAMTRIASLLDDQVLGPQCYPAKFTGAFDDNIDHYIPNESWVAEFEIIFRCGKDNWEKWEFYPETAIKSEDVISGA